MISLASLRNCQFIMTQNAHELLLGSLAGDADEEVGDSSLPKVVTKKGRMLPPRAIVAG